MPTNPKPGYRISDDLAEDILMHLDRETTINLADSEEARKLLRRLREEMARSAAEDRSAWALPEDAPS